MVINGGFDIFLNIIKSRFFWHYMNFSGSDSLLDVCFFELASLGLKINPLDDVKY